MPPEILSPTINVNLSPNINVSPTLNISPQLTISPNISVTPTFEPTLNFEPSFSPTLNFEPTFQPTFEPTFQPNLFLRIGDFLPIQILPELENTFPLWESLTKAESPRLADKSFIEAFTDYNIYFANAIWCILGSPLGLFPFLYSLAQPMDELLRQRSMRLWMPSLPTPIEAIEFWRRGTLTEGEVDHILHTRGFSPIYRDSFKDLRYVLPTPSDIITWLAREAFEPDAIERFKLDWAWDEVFEQGRELFEKIGLPEDTASKHWIAHWVHPGWAVLSSLRHRDKITDDDLHHWYRLTEMCRYWWEGLDDLIWDLPNRIEIRMMCRYLDMTKSEVMDMLKKAGLREDFRSDVADFMIIMGLQGYWRALYRNKWLTKEELRSEIEAKELSPIIADRVYKYIVKQESSERVEEYRGLTKSEIIKGWKKKILSLDKAIQLLQKYLKYSKDEAEYIMAVEGAIMGSPETELEIEELAIKYKKAIGEEVIEIPPEVLEAEKDWRELERKLKEAIEVQAPPEEISKLEADIALAKSKFERLRAFFLGES